MELIRLKLCMDLNNVLKPFNIINNVIDCLNNYACLVLLLTSKYERCFSVVSRCFFHSTGYYKLKSYQNINISALCVAASTFVAESSPSE